MPKDKLLKQFDDFVNNFLTWHIDPKPRDLILTLEEIRKYIKSKK